MSTKTERRKRALRRLENQDEAYYRKMAVKLGCPIDEVADLIADKMAKRQLSIDNLKQRLGIRISDEEEPAGP